MTMPSRNLRWRANAARLVWTCSASSRVGTRMSACTVLGGHGARAAAIFCRSGRPNAAVLPVPVCAIAIRSRPPSRIGIALAWMGVGVSKFSERKARRMGSESPNASKEIPVKSQISVAAGAGQGSRLADSASAAAQSERTGFVDERGTEEPQGGPARSPALLMWAPLAPTRRAMSSAAPAGLGQLNTLPPGAARFAWGGITAGVWSRTCRNRRLG